MDAHREGHVGAEMTQIVPYQDPVSDRISNEPYLADTEQRYVADTLHRKAAVSASFSRTGDDTRGGP
jgi:hypothetical protein